jgi:predicted amidohydrolase
LQDVDVEPRTELAEFAGVDSAAAVGVEVPEIRPGSNNIAVEGGPELAQVGGINDDIAEKAKLSPGSAKCTFFGYHSEERQRLRPGADVTVVPTPWSKAGFAICYDLRFPEHFRRMVDHGAELFIVTSAWPQPRGDAWVLFNRARAVENMAYLFSCNCAGEQAGRRYVGHSMIVDPGGKVLAEGGSDEQIVTADVHPGRVAELRAELPFLADR